MNYRFNHLALATLVAGTLTGCGGGSLNSSSGTLNLGITDAPVTDAKAVYVQFSGLQIHGEGGTTDIDFDAPKQFNLLDLSEGLADTLPEISLPAGVYQWIRLKVDTAGELDTYLVKTDDTVHELEIPSGHQSGLKLNRGFTVSAGGTVDLTIDFDLRKSLVLSQHGYHLKPVLRLVDNMEVGAVGGAVLLSHYSCDATGNAVYVFAGHGVTPSDISVDPETGETTGPVTTAEVRYRDDGTYTYRAAFLPAGDYTVALTCLADTDEADSTQDLQFQEAYEVTIIADAVIQQSFPAP